MKRKKRCPRCTLTKPRRDFASNRHAPDGLQAYCKPCQAARQRARRAADPEAAREKERAYNRANPGKALARHKKWLAQNHDRWVMMRRNCRIKKSYGLSNADFEKLAAAQGGVCAICKSPPNPAKEKGRFLHIDHCHATGRVRGLLCNRCNRAVGLFGDDSAVVAAAVHYLSKGGTCS